MKIKYEKPRYLLLLTAVLIVLNILLFVLAMLFYPDYNQVEQTLSKLVTKWPAAMFFNLALASGIFSSIIVVYIFHLELRRISSISNKQRNVIISIFSLIPLFMSGVLVFPSMGQTSDIHDLIAVLLFIFMGIGTATLSNILDKNLEQWNRSITYLGYSIPVLVIILGYLLSFGEYGPIIQKITVLLFDIWIIWTVRHLTTL